MRFRLWLLALVLYAVVTPGAEASSGLPDGGLVAVRAVAGASGLASADGNGGWRWITESAGTPWERRLEGTSSPDVAPDGTQILFAGPGTNCDQTSSEILELDTDPGSHGDPASWTGQAICDGRLDGDAHDPVWFPGPTWTAGVPMIAFSFTPRDAPDRSQIMAISDSRLRQLTWATRNTSPTFSPDGSEIAYTAYPANAAGGLPRVFVMSSRDGTGKRKLTTLPASHPDWSPDGTQLTFQLEGCGTDPCGIATARADGTHIRRLTTATDGDPAFSPDGRRIAFARRPAGADQHWQLFTMQTDGTGARVFERESTGDWTQPAWVRPAA